MKINWKLRLQNKATLLALATLVIGFVYQILGLLGVVPSVSEDSVMNIVLLFVNLLAALGVIVDPTTKGVLDSNRALTYSKPNDEDESEG